MRIFSSDENLRRLLRRISLTRISVFDMLISRRLSFRFKLADVSLSERGKVVPYGLTPHSRAANVFDTFPNEVPARQAQGLPYPRRTPMGYDGGSVYLRAVYSFN